MVRRIFILAFAAALCAGATSCQKLKPQGTLGFEKLESLSAIPAEYGDLVGVTSIPGNPDWVHAWFQKPDKTIVILSLDVMHGAMYGRALVIPRK